MAITREQALKLDTFHVPDATQGQPRCFVWRRNGKTKTWETRPEHYRVPVKYGLYLKGYIKAAEMVAVGEPSGDNAFAPEDCPICHGAKR